MSRKKPPILPLEKLEALSLGVVVDLPEKIYIGIGKIISAHSFLENRIQELLFDLMIMADYPAGRVAFEYRSAQVMFGTVRRLMTMWDIKSTADLNQLEQDIKARADQRDRFAHNVWIARDGELKLRLTSGVTQVPDGRLDHAYVPLGVGVVDEAYDAIRDATLKTAMEVKALQIEITPALQALRKRYFQPSPSGDHT